MPLPSENFPPITREDLLELGIESHLIPFAISAVSRAEQSSNDCPTLEQSEAKDLVEILDKVVSPSKTGPTLRNRCFRVLRKVSQTHIILPKSYHLVNVTLLGTVPYRFGGFVGVWKAEMDGRQVSVKGFQTQTTESLHKIKRRFYHEIIVWKYTSHPNLVPFLGVSETVIPFCIVSPWFPNGNILEYINNNPEINRLQLLEQAARGLEHLHSLSIVHSDVKPGNILIDNDSIARLGDFGITGVITDPTVIEPGSATTSKPGVVRYMAPELLKPAQFHLPSSNPTKESDIYSMAMTMYQVLTGVLPYGGARDGIIIFQVVTGGRPTRPANDRWLRDQTWDMIEACWKEQRELRWDIRAVLHQLSVSSIQEIAEGEREALITTQSSNDTEVHPLPPLPPLPGKEGSNCVEVPSVHPLPNPPTNKGHSNRPSGSKPEGKTTCSDAEHSQTAPPPGKRMANLKKHFTFPTPRSRPQDIRQRKSTSWILKPVRAVFGLLPAVFRFKKSRKTNDPPAT